MREAGFDLPRDLGERRLIHHREVGEHLAVDVDLRALQAGHEGAVGHAELAHGGVDARDPQRAESALPLAAVAVRVLPRLHHRLLGDAEHVLPAAAEPLRLLEDLLVARARCYSTFYSWHGAPLSSSTAACCGSPPSWCGAPRCAGASDASAWCSSW